MQRKRRHETGFSLIEVMIALLVLAIGILGAGALQTVGLQTTQGAYLRSQGIILASDIVDRMRANRKALAAYVVATGAVTVTDIPSCWIAAGGCTPAEIANADLSRWKNSLTNTLPNGVGQIASNGGDNYTVTVTWDENEWAGAARGNTPQSVTLNVAVQDL